MGAALAVQIPVNFTTQGPQQVAGNTTSRLLFVDHLRAFLIILVVLHHVAIVYGAIIPFYYVEPPIHNPLAFQVLLVFVLVNQSWFMGVLFLLAGYFTPGSYDRKGPVSFLKDRLLRLGIPLLGYIFVLSPLSSIGYFLMPEELTGITTPLTWHTFPYFDFLDMGPMWFVAMLLIFSFCYVLWRMATRNRTSPMKKTSSVPSHVGIGIFILVLAGVSYLFRMGIPLGKEVFGFPTLSYLPQYLSFFVLGVVASRHDWFQRIPGSMGVAGFVTAMAAGVFLFPLAFSGHLLSLRLTPAMANLMGHGHWRSAVYALWDSFFAVGMCLGLITFFRRFLNGQGGLGRFLSQQSYMVYIIHIPILIFIAFALRSITLAPMLKFGLAAGIVCPTCFAAAYVIRKVPGVSRIL
jgi:peptidoglycan/LPS O-acetylase OafA/YrhL